MAPELATVRGSSPRVRGRALRASAFYRQEGIIPAGAGKRKWTFTRRSEREDHPRGCGEEILERLVGVLK